MRITSYEYIHNKLKKERGRAAEQVCENCNDKQAAHWALSASTEDICYQIGTKQEGRAFSQNVSDYLALCRPCHSKYDKENGLMRGPAGNRSERPKVYCTVEVDGAPCPRRHKAHGLCEMHYKREQRKARRES